MKQYIFIIAIVLIQSCSVDNEKSEVREPTFRLMTTEETGIDFINELSFNEEFNVYTYRNFYNGGGVSLGDINNDGLIDIYFTANLKENKLYLNKGNFQFEDITKSAGVGGKMGWSTGVTMADVNADGYLDIYVCNSGNLKGDRKKNELFINNGNNTFEEKASEYGLDDEGYSTHASFFDYDKDGDLDVYLLNNSFQAIGSFNLERNERVERDTLGGDKLLRFNGERFEDVSEEAGIYGSVIGFGLGVTVGDVNRDGWEDIYVSNDFFERDYLYINNQDGTFSEQLTSSMKSISGASMGADMADINNDGYSEIFVTEMLPGDYQRLKSVTTFENWDKYQYNVKNGYYHQFTRNTFQLNNRNNTFSEIGRLAGVEATDWSWGALIFDMDNDGLKDLFVANGIYQDLTDQDYLNYISNEEVMRSIITNHKVDYKKLIDIIPSNAISNKAFKNLGDLQFKDVTGVMGLDSISFSNGAAYGDLDNDGDLDLVVNNVNMPSFVYKNQVMELNPKAHYLRFELKGSKKNTFALGAKIEVEQNDKFIYLEQQPIKGFQSSVDPRPLVGLPDSTPVNIVITWSSGSKTVLKNIEVDQTLSLGEEEADASNEVSGNERINEALFVKKELPFKHRENSFVDFDRDRLLYHMRSTEGPKLATGDIDGDGLDDVYIGGSRGTSGALLYSGAALRIDSVDFIAGKETEDTDAIFFDADNDGDLDLYVCSGSSEFTSMSVLLKDKLYFNNDGRFVLSDQTLPVSTRFVNSSTVVPLDFDKDGDMDLFVGERLIPLQYGKPASGYLLQNDGSGQFKDVTIEYAQEFNSMGLITDAVAIDYDNDGDSDLVVVGEYMSPSIFLNEDGEFKKLSHIIDTLTGWWNVIEPADINGDGHIDFVVGNHGMNSRFQASDSEPIALVLDDFDRNGFYDPILTKKHKDGKYYPFALRHNLAMQLKFVLKKYPDYKSFKNASITDILGEEMYNDALKLEVTTLESGLLINDGKGNLSFEPLPLEAQFSSVYAIESGDFDKDGDLDILLGGNLYGVKPEVGRYDASYGLYLENDGEGNFTTFTSSKGFTMDGEIRDIKFLGDRILVARNNQTLIEFRLK